MSAQKDSTKHAHPSKKSNRWKICRNIAYAVAALLAVGGAVFSIRGVAGAASAIGVAFWIALFTYLIDKEQKKRQVDAQNARLGMVKLTMAAAEYLGKDYRKITTIYQNLGFRNISAVSLHDMRHIMTNKPGATESVTIGDKKAGVDEWYHPDAEVVITYHDFAE